MVARALAPPMARRVTRDEYYRMGNLGFFLGERVELLQGIVVRIAPIGPAHASVVDRLAEILVPRLSARARVRIQQPFSAADDSEPEPDVAIVPEGRYSDRHPDRALLVIEVADSSLEHDRLTKGPVYAQSGVSEYWIVDVAGRVVETHAGPMDGRFTRTRRGEASERLTPEAFPDIAIEIAAILP